MVKKAFFLDRDGTINVEVDYLGNPDEAVLLDGVGEAIKQIHAAGFLAIAVTNQAGVAKGYYPEANVHAVNTRIQQMLLTRYGSDALVDAWYYCPHHEKFTGECSCRKPQPGMLLRAAADFGIDMSRSFMIGDRMSDINAGINAGCAGECLVLTGYGQQQTDAAGKYLTAPDLLNAVKLLLAR